MVEEIRSAETVYLQMHPNCLQAKAIIYCHLSCLQGRKYFSILKLPSWIKIWNSHFLQITDMQHLNNSSVGGGVVVVVVE